MSGENRPMNIRELRSIVDMIRDADRKELIVVSLFILPLLLGAWSVFLNSIDFLGPHDGWKCMIICVLSILYVGGIIYMKKADTEEGKLKRARYHIETRLKKRGGQRASFDAIRNEVNESYSDDFLNKLIDLNPEIFGTCTIKRSKKRAITLVKVESEDNQSTE